MVHHRYIPPFLHVVPSLLPHFNFIIHTRATRIIFLDIIFTSFHIVIISWKTPLNITRSFLARTVKLARVRIVPLFFSRPFVDECHARRAQPKSAATPSPNSLERTRKYSLARAMLLSTSQHADQQMHHVGASPNDREQASQEVSMQHVLVDVERHRVSHAKVLTFWPGCHSMRVSPFIYYLFILFSQVRDETLLHAYTVHDDGLLRY